MKNGFVISLLIINFLLMILIACHSTSGIQSSMKPGVQLWTENCSRCHNITSTADFSDAEWDLIVGSHMRSRANLTAMEAKTIVEFLKKSN